MAYRGGVVENSRLIASSDGEGVGVGASGIGDGAVRSSADA